MNRKYFTSIISRYNKYVDKITLCHATFKKIQRSELKNLKFHLRIKSRKNLSKLYDTYYVF